MALAASTSRAALWLLQRSWVARHFPPGVCFGNCARSLEANYRILCRAWCALVTIVGLTVIIGLPITVGLTVTLGPTVAVLAPGLPLALVVVSWSPPFSPAYPFLA